MAEFDWRSLLGHDIEGRYHISEFIDAGSYGGVFRADEVVGGRLMRSLALKILNPVEGDNEYRRNLVRDKQLTELQYAAGLDHPHIIRCHSVGQWQSPQGPLLYIAMELAEISLEEVLAGGPLEQAQAADIMRQLATALEYLHSEGRRLVHRDIKPGNILLSGGQWKLSDLGTAVALGEEDSVHVLAFGTAEYAPPESYDGIVSTAWDIWSLGVVLVECLSQELPFNGLDQTELMNSVCDMPPHIPEQLGQPFARIARLCLVKERERRIGADTILHELTGYIAGEPAEPETEFPDNPFALNDDGEALMLLEQRIRVALADQLISSLERAELNDLARELRVPLATARDLFNRVRREMLPPAEQAAPATPQSLRLASAQPDTLLVGGTEGYPTITSAIRAARPGSQLIIAAGSYNEQLVIDRELTLSAQPGGGPVRVVSRDRHTVLLKTARCTLENLELICRVSNESIRAAALCLPFGRCQVRGCTIASEGDVCVTAFGRSSHPHLNNCELSGGRNACLSISHHASVSLRGCRLERAGLSGVFIGSGSRLLMERCRISGMRGSGLLFHEDGTGELIDCSVRDCLEHGVQLGGNGEPRFGECEICGNHGWGVAGGAQCRAVFSKCEIHVNGRGSRELSGAPHMFEHCRLD